MPIKIKQNYLFKVVKYVQKLIPKLPQFIKREKLTKVTSNSALRIQPDSNVPRKNSLVEYLQLRGEDRTDWVSIEI